MAGIPKPVVLCILDGWGWRQDSKDNAIALARTPNYDRLLADYPMSQLETSGLAVGLPDGQMGNSEVGHMNIGSGRVVLQDLPRIDDAIASNALANNAELQSLIQAVSAQNGTVHLAGLLSPGGVHSHQDHLVALAKIISAAGVPVAIHALLDGRDTPPKSALDFIKKFESDIADLPNVQIATIGGRFFGMDRDKRWERIEKAYQAMVSGVGNSFTDTQTAIEQAYAADETDEFVSPAVREGYAGMNDGDGLLMGNFRADRARQILKALLDPHFDGFARAKVVTFAAVKGMVAYADELSDFMQPLFPPIDLVATLGEVVSEAGFNQLRISETEKYAHVTFFLNGGRETVFENEERILIPSPKVETYDLQPTMSAYEVTERLETAIASGDFELIVVNYANPDMVGHTGVFSAAVEAVETVDTCLGRLRDAVTNAGGAMLVCADHGNIELMRDQKTGEPHTAHTNGPVPFVGIGEAFANQVTLKDGRLCDIAPTILELLQIQKPSEMTGSSLLEKADGKKQTHDRISA